MTQPTEPKSVEEWQGKLPGVVVTAFVAAVGFLGIKDEEISVLLRNNPAGATVIAALLVGAVAVATTSIFIGESRVRRWFAFPVLAATVAVALGFAYSIKIPGETKPAPNRAPTLIILVLLIVGLEVALLVVVPPARRWLSQKMSVGLVLSLAAIVLLGSALFGALKLETRNQVRSVSPQMTAEVKTEKGKGVLTVKFAATKLRPGEHGILEVKGLERGTHVPTLCQTEEKTGISDEEGQREACQRRPCLYIPDKCFAVLDTFLYPNDFGALDKEFVVPFVEGDVEHFEILGNLCRLQNKAKTPSSAPTTTTKGEPATTTTTSPVVFECETDANTQGAHIDVMVPPRNLDP